MPSDEIENATGPLSTKERFDAVMKLADFRMQRIRDRRENEWKVTLGFWALLAASPLYVTRAPPPDNLAHVLALVCALFLVFWLVPLGRSHQVDSKAMFAHYHAAELLAGQPLHHKPADPLWMSSWWAVFQGVATIVLAVVAWWAIENGILHKP